MNKNWQKNIHALLISWPFLLSLILLLCNDWYLKSHYPGILTGKISDFAGIAMVSMLLLSIYSHHKYLIYIAISLVFLWWKSPFSDSMILIFNEIAPYSISRVIDYTDLIALLFMPISHYIITHIERYQTKWHMPFTFKNPIVIIPILGTTLFAIMGTSAMPENHQYSINSTQNNIPLPRDEIIKTLQSIAIKNKMSCEICVQPEVEDVFFIDRASLHYKFIDANTLSLNIKLSSMPDPMPSFWRMTGEKWVKKLKKSIIKEFSNNEKLQLTTENN